MKKNLLSADELARALNVPNYWVYSRCGDGFPSLPRIYVDDNIFFKFDEVLDWMLDHVEILEFERHLGQKYLESQQRKEE